MAARDIEQGADRDRLFRLTKLVTAWFLTTESASCKASSAPAMNRRTDLANTRAADERSPASRPCSISAHWARQIR